MCVSPIHLVQKDGKHVFVPCGKCAECLVKRRNDWSVRLQQELDSTDLPSYFVTLTYDESSVPLAEFVSDDGRSYMVGSLVPDDLSRFIRRVRDNMRYDLKTKGLSRPEIRKMVSFKFFGAGEYGTKTLRPHYHVLFFGVHFNREDFTDFVEKSWKLGLFRVDINNDARCHYTAKYMVKPQGFCMDVCVPPFSVVHVGLVSHTFKALNTTTSLIVL